MSESEEILKRLQREIKGKRGLFCLNCLLTRSSFEELNEFIEKNNIEVNTKINNKTEFLKHITAYYYNYYNKTPEIKKKYMTSLDLMGELLLKDDKIKKHLIDFDFISKQEIIDIFADYCADLQINVFSTSGIEEYSLDLYLTKKTPFLRTEAVIVRTGEDLTETNYQNALNLIKNASIIAMWTVFVTTPAGVYKIGFDRLISDMESLNVWLYVVDPMHKNILGITKGKKSKNYTSELCEKYIQMLPREPVRAPSQVVKFSKYHFKESESYKSKFFIMFELVPEEDFKKLLEIPNEKHIYRAIFRNILIIEINSGISIFSYSNEETAIDDNLISGFLTAMDNFVAEIGGPTSLKEINYKGFFVHAVYGKDIKIALFLSEPADKILKERLAYFNKIFEDKYKTSIDFFKETGNTSYFDRDTIIKMVKESLSI